MTSMTMMSRIAPGARRLINAAVLAAGVVGAVGYGALTVLKYRYPVVVDNSEKYVSTEKPFWWHGYLALPIIVVREKDCATQSTIILRRDWDFGPALGVRPLVRRLDAFNNSLTEMGTYPIVILTKPDPDLPPGEYEVIVRSQDDCGGLLGESMRRPRERRLGKITLPAVS